MGQQLARSRQRTVVLGHQTERATPICKPRARAVGRGVGQHHRSGQDVRASHHLVHRVVVRGFEVTDGEGHGAAPDATLDELRLELVFPQDEVAESLFAALGRTA